MENFFRLSVSNHILSKEGLRAIKIFPREGLDEAYGDKPCMMFIYNNTSVTVKFDSDDALFDYSAAIEKCLGTLQIESDSYWEENKHIIKRQ